MPKQKMGAKKAELDSLAKKLIQLVEIFRRGGKATDFNWWHSRHGKALFNPLYGYQDGQPLFEEVVQGVLNLNSKMLSEHEVETKITYDFLMPQTTDFTKASHLNNRSLLNEGRTLLTELVEFQAWQDVDIPIANLWLEGEPVKLGYVTFMALTEEELERWKKQGHWPELAPEVHVAVAARVVRAPGDEHKARAYARKYVNRAVDALRAFCFPFGRGSEAWRVGVLGDIIASTATPVRINGKHFVTEVSPYGIVQIDLRDHILSKLESPQWELLNKLFLKVTYSNMENKLLDGIHWLAESTKPDTNNSKFAKISFALETLIGGEPKKAEELKVRGITAMLAERATFIAGKDLDDRLAIDKDIRKYYGMRGTIVHGGEGDVSLDDIDGFGQLVRRLAIALLEKTDELEVELSDVNKLQAWVNKQKYTLPNNKGKEAT